MFVVWALNAIRWCVRECTWTRTGRSTCLMRTRKTLGRPTTPVRSGFMSEGVLSRNETLQLEEILHSGSLAEGYDYRSNLRDLELDPLGVRNLSLCLRLGMMSLILQSTWNLQIVVQY